MVISDLQEKVALRGGSPFDAQKLIGKYDTIIQHERMLMGLFKYNKSPKNRQLAYGSHGGGYYAGGLGLLGDRAGVEAMKGCDLLLMLGTDFPYHDWVNKEAVVIQVNRKLLDANRRVAQAFPVIGDCEWVVPYLLKNTQEKKNNDFVEEVRKSLKN